MSKIKLLLEKMGVSENNETIFNFNSGLWKQKIPLRIKKGLEEIKPNFFWIHEGKIIALFFDFTKDMVNKQELFKKIWNLGGVPAIFILNETTIDIYNGFSFDLKKENFDLLKINDLVVSEENIHETFSIWDVLSGKTLGEMPQKKSFVSQKLLENLENTKKILINEGLEDKYAQSIMGRLLFSRYLLDRKIKIDEKYFKDNDSFLNLIKNKTMLYNFFNYLKQKFNGDLFPISEEEVNQVTEIHLNYLHALFSGDEISKSVIQKSLFNIYNFKIIPVELISEVYERFMGNEKQETQSAYYTPSFLVDYVLEKTIKQHLINNNSCKVFDPSCGSGIFLVESLRYIIEKFIETNGEINVEQLKELLIKNIYGVDIDESAINLTAFSLCLTLLDYVNPKDIATFKFPSLKENNLFVCDFFDVTNNFNHKINEIDFIIGNPPWGSDKQKENLHIQYIKINELPVSDKQIAQSFILRAKDFFAEKTKCAFVLPSSILYNFNANKFRNHWLNSFEINEILELSSVRKNIFSSAIAPTMVAFFRQATENNNIINHISIKPNIFLEKLNLIVIEKNDLKTIKQDFFIKYDWLWKIMLYGNVFDFQLVKRLKENYSSLNEVIEKKNLSFGQGFQVGGGDKNNGVHLLGKLFLDTKKKKLKSFYVDDSHLEKWTMEILHRPRTKEVFQPPYVLLTKGFNREKFSLVSVYSEQEFVFKDSVTAIRSENKELLKNITGILNSKFASYFFILQSPSAGVEREQGHNETDRFNTPIIENQKITKIVDEIQDEYKKYYSNVLNSIQYEEELNSLKNKLDDLVLNTFEFNELEKDLLNYAIEITIPLINNSKKPIEKSSEKQLKKYAEIFFNHFSKRWNGNPDYFEIDVYQNEYIIGINFKIVDKKPEKEITIYEGTKLNELHQLMKLGEEKITDVFYKQRDIRGFNETSFYVIKANQYKNWHPAIAYSDLSEFVEAMLQAETEGEE